MGQDDVAVAAVGGHRPAAAEAGLDVEVGGGLEAVLDLLAAAEEDVDALLLALASDWIPRGELIVAVIRRTFCQYYLKEIRGRIEALLKEKQLVSQTGKTRINDEVQVKRVSGRSLLS